MPNSPVQPGAGGMAPQMGQANMRRKIKAARDPEIQEILHYGRIFLEQTIPAKNVITMGEFQTYLPLFNIAQFKSKTKEEIQDLGARWAQRINIQHPVYIIDPSQPDPNGKSFGPDQTKCKVVYTLPAWTKALVSCNQVAPNNKSATQGAVQATSEEMANAVRNKSPFDNAPANAAEKIGVIVELANKERSDRLNREYKKYEQQLLHKGEAPTAKVQTKTPEQNEPAGIDADWE